MSKLYGKPGKEILKCLLMILKVNPTIKCQLFKINLDTISSFEEKFIFILRRLYSIITRYSYFPKVYQTLSAAIFRKVNPRNDLVYWNSIKDALVQNFADLRSLEQILIVFSNIKLDRNESIINFVNKIRNSFAKLIANIKLTD